MGSKVELKSGRGRCLKKPFLAVLVGPGLFRKYCKNPCQVKLKN